MKLREISALELPRENREISAETKTERSEVEAEARNCHDLTEGRRD